jgi:hypothetical protein|tara:strand:- start:9865 stop:10020 length:156 start_codon:yes stop_codon:yes gene_type:complete
MFESLKSGGRISIQIGFGKDHPDAVGYYNNKYSVKATNGAHAIQRLKMFLL